MAYGKIKADAFIYDDGGDQEITTATIASNSNKADSASPTFTGTVTLPATTALAGQASDVTMIDNNAAALEVKEGSTTYVNFDTTNSGEQVEVNVPLVLNSTTELRLADSDSSNYVALKSGGTVSTNSTWTLPTDAPSASDVLTVTSVSSNNPTLEWAPAVGGKVLQYKNQNVNVGTALSGNQTTFTDTGVEGTFTPTASDSTVAVNLSLFIYHHASTSQSGASSNIRLMRDKGDGNGFTEIKEFGPIFIRLYLSSGTTQYSGPMFYSYLDSPATTSEVTYKIQYRNSSAQASYLQWPTTADHTWNFWEIAA